MRTLRRLTIQNFKSIRHQALDLSSLNLFIGANGAGKSNLVGVFRLLNRIVNAELQLYTGQAGGADSILHFGRKRSSALFVDLEFAEGDLANGYQFTLIPTSQDRFVFGSEKVFFHDQANHPDKPYDESLGAGHTEARLPTASERLAAYVRSDLASYRIYHFHDTSAEAKIKQTGNLDDNRSLLSDAANLAAFLYRLKQASLGHYQNIEDTIRQIAPFFAGFRLEPEPENPKTIKLSWAERGYEGVFGASALSDGTLRFMCLATLLLQPHPPAVILLDEPELGLHPAAIGLLAAMLESAATRTQVIVATQSVTLVNQFTPEVVRVVDRKEGESVFRRLDPSQLDAWLDGYSLGELWEKNIIGGRP